MALDKIKIKPRNYQTLHIDFSIYDGKPLYIIGDYLDVIRIEGITDPSNILIRFNEGEFIPLDVVTPANTPFYSLQLINTEGKKGKITLLIGQEYFRVASQTITILRDLAGLLKVADLPTIIRTQKCKWAHGTEITAPTPNQTLVSATITVGKIGFIHGFFISAGEPNDFLINWVCGGAQYSIRIPFSGKGALQYVDYIALNEGLPADGGTNMTITNVNAGSTGIVYQARLLYVEV